MKNMSGIMDKILTRIGSSNDSEIVTASLAAFKLIFIPVATMSDKEITPKQKAYAIKRDFVTELIALMGYIGITGLIKNNFTAPVCSKYYKQKANELAKAGKLDINSDDFKTLINTNSKLIKKSIKEATLNNQEKDYVKNLQGLAEKFSLHSPQKLYTNTKKTISHICVCTLALTIIPMITNKILEMYSKRKSKHQIQKDVSNKIYTPNKIEKMSEYMAKTRIGGLNVFNY